MKNKLLVLTLAFAMMLSFMPMASFAASDHDDTHYTYEIYIWDDDADCEHVDNEYHRVTGTGEVEVWCEDCEMVVDSYEIEADGDEFSHDYDEEGYCETCDYHCTHLPEKLAEEYYWEEGEGEGKATCTPVNDKFHEVTGAGEKEIYCEYCGKTISIGPYVFNEDLFSHEYDENGYCDLCGHTNKCPHDPDNWEEAYIWDDNTTFVCENDDAYHIVTGTAEVEVWCGDCGMMMDGYSYEADGEEFPHEYDENGYCDLCGHTNNCQHEDIDELYEIYIWDDGTAFVSVDDEFHSVTGTGEKETWCDKCQMMIKSEAIEADGEEFPHIYNNKGVCEDCGHETSLDDRIYGKSRYDTARAVADKMKEEIEGKFDNIIVAYGENYPDALSGGYLAKVKNAPILLVNPSVEDDIIDYISKNIASDGTVYILGGTGVVSSAFERNIRDKGIYPVRLFGKSRYETNLEILKAAEVDDEEILICTGTDYADSLSASAAGMPILLVGNTLTDAQRKYIQNLNTEQFYLIGGKGAVKPEIESDLIELEYSEDNITRIAGKTRYETSTAVAEELFDKSPQTVVLAYAQNFPDGLSGGPLAMLYDAPIILTDSNNTKAAREYVKEVEAFRNITLGGKALISDAAVKVIMGR